MTQRRNTTQRIKILEYLKNVKTHPTAEIVYENVVKDLPSITLATVYRNLNLLAEEGEVLRLEVNKEYRYDADISLHQHFVCEECGKVADIFEEEISNHALKKIKAKNFKAKTVTIIFRGICDKCS